MLYSKYLNLLFPRCRFPACSYPPTWQVGVLFIASVFLFVTSMTYNIKPELPYSFCRLNIPGYTHTPGIDYFLYRLKLYHHSLNVSMLRHRQYLASKFKKRGLPPQLFIYLYDMRLHLPDAFKSLYRPSSNISLIFDLSFVMLKAIISFILAFCPGICSPNITPISLSPLPPPK